MWSVFVEASTIVPYPSNEGSSENSTNTNWESHPESDHTNQQEIQEICDQKIGFSQLLDFNLISP